MGSGKVFVANGPDDFDVEPCNMCITGQRESSIQRDQYEDGIEYELAYAALTECAGKPVCYQDVFGFHESSCPARTEEDAQKERSAESALNIALGK